MTARVTSLDEFALLLSGQLGKFVSNRAGLVGKWDFDLNYIPPSASISVDADGPGSLFTAVQEQLGLSS
jgi:uncharacterized protein (TIGR03435 family)